MRLLTLLFVFLCFTNSAMSQSYSGDEKVTQIVYEDAEPKLYRLYPTQNIWTFIKLNTSNGEMTQVQFSMDDNRMESPLLDYPLVYGDDVQVGRFALYPTQNIWTFILLDQIDGDTYQVQWSTSPENRGVLPIN